MSCPARVHPKASKRFEFVFLAAFGFQLNRGVLDIEALLERVFNVVEHLMKIAAVFYHRVSAQGKDVRGYRPDMQIMHLADTFHALERLLNIFKPDASRNGLHEHNKRFFHEIPRRVENQKPDKNADQWVGNIPT